MQDHVECSIFGYFIHKLVASVKRRVDFFKNSLGMSRFLIKYLIYFDSIQ